MKILKKILFSAAALVVFIIFIEIIFSYVFPMEFEDYDIGIVSRYNTFSRLYDLDRTLIWKFKGNTISATLNVNPSGFRGRDFKAKKNDSCRVICVGDDILLGSVFVENFTVPSLLESSLIENMKDTGIEVYNAAVTGYSTYQSVKLAEKLLSYKPDIVVLVSGLNDVRLSPLSDEHRAGRYYREKFRQFMYNFHFYRLSKSMIMRFRDYETDKTAALDRNPKRVSEKEFEKYISELSALLKKNGVRLLFVPDSLEDEAYYRFQIKKASDCGIETLDIKKDIRAALKRFYGGLTAELGLAAALKPEERKRIIRCLHPGKQHPSHLYLLYEYLPVKSNKVLENIPGAKPKPKLQVAIMKDDGLYPDEKSGDYVYTAGAPIVKDKKLLFHFSDELMGGKGAGGGANILYEIVSEEDMLPLYVHNFDYLFINNCYLNENGLHLISNGLAELIAGIGKPAGGPGGEGENNSEKPY